VRDRGVLEIAGLTKQYGRREAPAISKVTFSISPGEVVGLVGLNGAGKSTTLRSAAGVILPTDGHVVVDGHDVVTAKARASELMGWVPEVPIHDASSRIGPLLSYYAALCPRVAPETTGGLLRSWGLEDLGGRRYRTLSLGQRMRFAIACAQLQDPRYYLLDEVFNGIDAEGIRSIRRWIISRREAGCAVLLSSHQLAEVQQLADRIVFLHRGKVASIRSRAEIASVGSPAILVTLDRVDAAVLELLRAFGGTTARGNQIRVAGSHLDPGEVSAALVRAGYRVLRLEPEEVELESYFLDLVKEPA
jgi:ABC-2 type transport system ATP-binding protein